MSTIKLQLEEQQHVIVNPNAKETKKLLGKVDLIRSKSLLEKSYQSSI